MKNLIIISNVPKQDFPTKIKSLKALINNETIVNWSNLPFLNRIIIICDSELNSFKLLNFLIENKVKLSIANYQLLIKENFTKISNNLEVDNSVDLHFENIIPSKKPDLKLNTTFEVNCQLPSPLSPSITVLMSP